MNNAILNIMMNKLKQTNPNAYSNINSLMQSGGDANGLLNQVLSNATPEQKQNFIINLLKDTINLVSFLFYLKISFLEPQGFQGFFIKNVKSFEKSVDKRYII